MLSELNNDTIARLVSNNPELEAFIKKVYSDQKRNTSMLVHELRNPLSLLKGTLQYIEMKHPEAKEFKYWSQMHELVDDMEHIMADASLLNSGNLINKENTNLVSLIQALISSFMPQAITNKIDLSLQVAPEDMPYFASYYCDPVKLKQVLSNLVKNAFEATEPGNFIHIILKYNTGEDSVPPKLSINICNNGHPIPEDIIDTIFQPFVTYKKGGTGVGLALVKKVVDLHYGTVQVQSDPELTSFTLLLPVVDL